MSKKQPWRTTTTTLFLLVGITGGFPFLASSASTSSNNDAQFDLADLNDYHPTSSSDLEAQFALGELRTYDGTGNHWQDQGAVGTLLLRLSGVDYPDSDPSGETEIRQGPNPRDISNIVINQRGQHIPSSAGMTDAVWSWGQFIDHDISLTDANRARNGAADVDVLDKNDPLYPNITFSRANHVVIDGVRAPFNELTSFLDASMVYGSSAERAYALRTFSDGLLKTSAGNLMPLNDVGLPNGGIGPDFFLGGDVRVNENVVLTSIHTLFVREHNRLASKLKEIHWNAGDENLYQLARKIVIAEIQKITYEEFLPALLGPYAPLGFPSEYNDDVSPAVAIEFSTAMFRFGHTLLSSEIMVGDDNQQETLSLKDAFSKPDFIRNKPENIGRLLRGLSVQPCQEVDSMIVEDVRTFLFLPPPNPEGLDLAVLNMQRGREQGLPVYNRVREGYGLEPVTKFSDISSDPIVQARLAEAYDSVEDIDAWVGGISEDPLQGANVGQLIAAALVDQFTRLRDGDRFFYTRDPDLYHQPFIAKYLKEVTFGRLVRLNTEEIDTPLNMFFMGGKST